MIRADPKTIARWRAELDVALDFRNKEFGTYRQEMPGANPTTTGAGQNLEAFEQGAQEASMGTLNVVFPIIKNIVPTLFFQNPTVFATPVTRTQDDGEIAFYAGELLNRDVQDPEFQFKETMDLSVFDGYALAMGVVKIGYATEFGADQLRTPVEEKTRLRDTLKDKVNQTLVALNLKAPTPAAPPDTDLVEANEQIRAERAYVRWISPFDFLIDPRARALTDARWCAQRVRRTLEEIKADRRYGNARHEFSADAMDDTRIPQSEVEAFQTADVWEIHYKNPESPTGITVLTLGVQQTATKALAHEHSVYRLNGWQYEWYVPNKHGHRLYPVSDISVIRPLIERLNSSLDAVLEQLDKFIAKVVYDKQKIKDLGDQQALTTGVIGAVVGAYGDPREAVAVISMQQVNAELTRFMDYLVDFIILITGLTRAQLTGITTAQTATEAQIGQGGQNVRRSDQTQATTRFVNRVITKLWAVKAQFEDFTDIDLQQGQSAINPDTGMKQFSWYPKITPQQAQLLQDGQFKFHLEVGSTQRLNLEIIRAQFENMMRALVNPVVTQGLALEGKRLSASELLRQWFRLYPEYIQDTGKVIVPVVDPNQQQSLLNFGQPPAPANGGANGNGQGLAGSPPNVADLVSSVAGERGQGVPGA